MRTGTEAEPLQIEGATLRWSAERSVTIEGQMVLRDGPIGFAEARGRLRALHERVAQGGGDVRVDVRGLSFCNSSAIRLFIEWLIWAKGADAPYTLVFAIDERVSWQKTSFRALKSVGGQHMRVEVSS